jgi:hypothetical protein
MKHGIFTPLNAQLLKNEYYLIHLKRGEIIFRLLATVSNARKRAIWDKKSASLAST